MGMDTKKIEIFGSGCTKCEKLHKAAKEAAEEMKLPYTISKVRGIREIAERGVAVTPALAIDGKVVSSGSIPSIDKIKKFLAE